MAYFRIALYLPFAVKPWTWELLIWVIVACVHQCDGSQKHSMRAQKAPPWNSAQIYCLRLLSFRLRSWKRNCCFYKTVFQYFFHSLIHLTNIYKAPISCASIGIRDINRRDKERKKELTLTMLVGLCPMASDPCIHSPNKYLLCNYYEPGSMLRTQWQWRKIRTQSSGVFISKGCR